MAKCNQLTPLPFKGLISLNHQIAYLHNVTQNLPLNYANVIFSLLFEQKLRHTALPFIIYN